MNAKDLEEISSGERYIQVMEMNRRQNVAEVVAAEETIEVTREVRATDVDGVKVTNGKHQNLPRITTAREAEGMDLEEEADIMDHRELEVCHLG